MEPKQLAEKKHPDEKHTGTGEPYSHVPILTPIYPKSRYDITDTNL